MIEAAITSPAAIAPALARIGDDARPPQKVDVQPTTLDSSAHGWPPRELSTSYSRPFSSYMRVWRQELESGQTLRVVSDMSPAVRAVVVGPPTEVGGLNNLLAGLNGDFELIGPIWPPAAVFAHVLQHSPEIVLVDYAPVTVDTRELIRNIRARFPAMKVVVVGRAETAEEVREAVRIGVSAYLSHGSGAEEFTAAFHALRGEHLVIGSEAARKLFATEASRVPLRRAELQVLRLLADGLTYDEITAQLEISRSTLKRYLNHIENKLNARNRVQAVAQAARKGLI